MIFLSNSSLVERFIFMVSRYKSTAGYQFIDVRYNQLIDWFLTSWDLFAIDCHWFISKMGMLDSLDIDWMDMIDTLDILSVNIP